MGEEHEEVRAGYFVFSWGMKEGKSRQLSFSLITNNRLIDKLHLRPDTRHD